MSRLYTKPLSILASDKLHLVPKMSPMKLIETMENISFWKDRNSASAVKLFTHCISRVNSLISELKVSEMVRVLFLYNKVEMDSKPFIAKIKNMMLNEVKEVENEKNEESPFYKCPVVDLLLLYKGFERNKVLEPRIHEFLISQIKEQKDEMINSDMCLFLKSHCKYLELSREEGSSSECEYLTPDLVKEVTNRLLKSYRYCIPEDLTSFVESLPVMSEFYGIGMDEVLLANSMFEQMSKRPVNFDVTQILRMIRSCSKLIGKGYWIREEDKEWPLNLISSLLGEMERRSEILEFKDCIQTLYSLSEINYWDPKLMKGMLYCIINKGKEEDGRKVYEIVKGNMERSFENKEIGGSVKDEGENEKNLREWAASSLEMEEILRRLKMMSNK